MKTTTPHTKTNPGVHAPKSFFNKKEPVGFFSQYSVSRKPFFSPEGTPRISDHHGKDNYRPSTLIQTQTKNSPQIQCEFVLKPLKKISANNQPKLTSRQLRSAIGFNNRFSFSRNELIALTDLFGIKSKSTHVYTLKKEVSNRVNRYQTRYNLDANGKIDYQTGEIIVLEINKENESLKGRINANIRNAARKIERYYKFDTNSAVLYVGMNSYDKEVRKINRGLPFENLGQLHTVKGEFVYEGKYHSKSEIRKFAKSIFPQNRVKQNKIAALLEKTDKYQRDELVKLIVEYHKTETRYNKRMTRLILSGHSGGNSILGDGGLEFKALVELQKIFPKAASQVLHLLVSACSAGTEDNVNNIFLKAYPNLRTFWGYYGACPIAGGPHINQWLAMTKGDVHKLKKRAGGGIAIWNEGVFQGNSSMSKADALRLLTTREAMYQEFFKGDKIAKDPYTGDLYQYYNYLRGFLGRSDLTTAEKRKYSQRRDQAVRLRFLKYISKHFVDQYKSVLKKGYGTRSVPDFKHLNRKQMLQEISSFDVKAKGSAADKKIAKDKLVLCLKQLNPSCVPENWLNERIQ